MVDIAEKVRKARLRWCGHLIRRDEGELVRDLKRSEDVTGSLVDTVEKVRDQCLDSMDT